MQNDIRKRAATANMGLALSTLYDAIEADAGSPRLALFYGLSGYGKTEGAIHAAAVTNAAYVSARKVWSAKNLLDAICVEIGILQVPSTASKMVDAVVAQLVTHPQPMIIDEMDYLVKKDVVDILRDIHDATDTAIMMIGMESLPAKLKEWEQFDNRIISVGAAQATTIADGRLLRDVYAADHITLADDLVDYFTVACNGCARRIVNNLNKAQRVAVEQLELTVIDRAAWGNRAVMTGDVPLRRR
jgi:DNA transposition AAA+ family ATPase